jgi:hypothetical protein
MSNGQFSSSILFNRSEPSAIAGVTEGHETDSGNIREEEESKKDRRKVSRVRREGSELDAKA